MKIELQHVGKKYINQWVFHKLSYTFTTGNAYAITGSNGSGKSTLLQIIAGSLLASEGKIIFEQNTSIITAEKIYQYISITAPYLDIIEEMTPIEFLRFHTTFKPFIPQQTITTVLEAVALTQAASKQIRYFSSGMKQRLKLAQVLFSDTPVMLLDEPCTNLDKAGIDMYHQLIDTYAKNKIIIVSSNDPVEYSFCNQIIYMKNFNAIDSSSKPTPTQLPQQHLIDQNLK